MKTYKHHYSSKHQISRKIIVISLMIICITMIIFFQRQRIQLAFKGYNITEQNMILTLQNDDIDKYLKSNKIDNLEMWNEHKNKQHYQDYAYYQNIHQDLSQKDVISYIDTFYETYYDKLIQLHYPYDQLLKMMHNADLNDFAYILKHHLEFEQTKAFLDIKGIIYTDLKSYIDSKKQPLDAILSISYPFIDAKYPVSKTYQIIDPSPISTLIKKGFQIPIDYIPDDLIIPDIPFRKDCDNKQLRKEAAYALEDMYQAALKSNLHLAMNSAYRSYDEQKAIYDEYHRLYDEVTANGLVAIPGSSEHQLGLGVDLTSQSVIDGTWRFFGDTAEYKWAIENAHLYGYILRYPSQQSQKTGTSNEPWHFRYVGKDIAKIIYDNNWTLEDYILNYGLSSHLKKINQS